VPTAKWNCTTIGQDAQAWQNNSTAKDWCAAIELCSIP
jgi:hypothetical protein